MTKAEFIEAIAQAALKYCTKYGICVVSPVIAQACLETGYGVGKGAEVKVAHHNYFGLKYRKNRVTCHSGYFSDGSQEQKADGTYVPITTDWYAFPNLEAGVEGYFQFINISNYANLKGVTDPHKYLELIKTDNYATDLNYVDKVYGVIQSNGLTKYDNKIKENQKGSVSMGYSNSPLVNCTVLSPNHSGQRTHSIDRITPHCVVGQLTAEAIGGCFPKGREASCNYGIGKDGRVCLIVEEKNRSWCSSSNANDQRAITIEVASDNKEPYAFTGAAYNKLVELCVDICKRNGKKKLLWMSDKNTALNYNPAADEMVLTVHRWFAAKSCPGDWMFARMGNLAKAVTDKLGGKTTTPSNNTPASNPSTPTATTNSNYPKVPFTVQVLVSDLNIRKTANGEATGKYTGKGTFTITQVSGDWGKLKSGAGWIYLKNGEYVSIGTGAATTSKVPYKVRVSITDLNIRAGAGTNFASKGVIAPNVYTIVEEKTGQGASMWGKLKSGAGWISLDHVTRV